MERTIRDDRGHARPMTRWIYNGQYPSPWHDIFPQMPATWRRFQILGYYVFIPFVLAMIASLLLPTGTPRDIARQIWDVFPYAMMPFVVVYIYLHFKQFRPWLKQYRIAQGRCCACDYNLESLTPDPDGCTTCPECGAAWKLPPPSP